MLRCRESLWIKTTWRRLLLSASLACLLLGLVTAVGRAQAPDENGLATVDDYVVALGDARQSLLRAGEADAALAQARAALAPIRQVLLPSGAQIEVAPLLGEGPEALTAAAALARVDTVLAQLEAAPGDDTAARLAVLAAVLAGPQFTAGDSLWDQFLRWLAEWLDRFLPRAQESPASTSAGGAAGDILWTVVGIGGAVALVLLLAYWLRGVLGNFIGDAQAAAAGDGGDLPQTPAEARRRAAERASSGDYRDAVRNLYLSALLTLEQNGVAPADRSLTNRELLARVPAGHPVRPHLQPVVETFDEVWYGVHEPDGQTYAAYTHSIDELETLAQHPPASGPAASGPLQEAQP